MALTLYFHPLSSYCQKVLLALYENGTAFTPLQIDMREADSRAKLTAVWPIGKFPVLMDGEKVIPESSIIIEYLAQHYPGPVKLLPDDPEEARKTRAADRFFDFYVNDQISRIIGDRLRPEGQRDPLGVERAKAALTTALGMIEKDMAEKSWATGDEFSMADCAASPALFYADTVMPFRDSHPNAGRYLDRLMGRTAFARVLKEARPYFDLIPAG